MENLLFLAPKISQTVPVLEHRVTCLTSTFHECLSISVHNLRIVRPTRYQLHRCHLYLFLLLQTEYLSILMYKIF